MIYTLTTNPAIDMNISLNNLLPNFVNRYSNALYTPNGKGLNVSFVLKHFGIESKTFGFYGGFSGNYIVEEASRRGVDVLPVFIDGITRINIFLNDDKKEYKMVGDGPFVIKEKQAELLGLINLQTDMNYLAISGSLPKGIEPEFYEELLTLCRKKNTEVILDISSKKLKELLKYKPFLIKPNDQELKDIFGFSLDSEEEIICALKEIHFGGAQNILLTLGEKGAYFFNGKNIYYSNTVPINLLSSACAGDAALAAFLSVWLEDQTKIEDAMKLSAATGANVAESPAIGDLKKVNQYTKLIIIKKITI